MRHVCLSLTLLVVALGCRTVIISPTPVPQQQQPPEERPRPTAVTLAIPPGHLPQPGECKIWIPGVPPGRQRYRRSRPCGGIAQIAPAGSWIVYRPTRDRRHVYVREVDQRRAGVVVLVRIFEWETGRFVRQTLPEDEPRDEDRPRDDRPRDDRPRDNRPPMDEPQVRPPVDRPRDTDPAPTHPATHGVPRAHLPQPGECRVWVPGMLAMYQPHRASSDCVAITRGAPARHWVLYRPANEPGLLHVRVVDQQRAGVITVVWIYNADSGTFVRETGPDVSNGPAIQRPPERPPEDRPAVQRPPDRPPEDRPPVQRPPEKPPEERPQDERPRDNKPPEGERPQGERPQGERPQNERPQNNRPPLGRPGPATAATLGIPAGQLPAPGECRVWIPGVPPGRQPHRATPDCDAALRAAPAGSWVVHRPTADTKVVHVRVVNERQAGTITVVRVFDAATGRFLREENP